MPAKKFSHEMFRLPYLGMDDLCYDLETAYEVVKMLGREYGCYTHLGMEKWLEVGLYKEKWFGLMWTVEIRLNPHFFQDGKVFFLLATSAQQRFPMILDQIFKNRKGRYREIRDFTVEEVKDRALLERELRKVLEEELVTGKAWEF